MTMRLCDVSPERYATEVLPLTAELWAGRRDFERYVSQTLEIARSGYGKRHYKTIGFYEGDTLLASCKRYERTIHFGPARLRTFGIGAVYTPREFRGRGYASAMIAMLLDAGRSSGFDAAYLFSDIRSPFYEALGFRELPSRAISLRADTLPNERVPVARMEESDWNGVRRCFDLADRARPWGVLRTPLVWEWVRMRARHGSEHAIGHETNLVVRRGRGIVAYVLGVRTPEHDAYIVDEYGFADADAAALIRPLLRSAAGDLRRVAGWLPPDGARELLPKGSVRKRSDSIFMAVDLSPLGKKWIGIASAPSSSDGIWSTDHI